MPARLTQRHGKTGPLPHRENAEFLIEDAVPRQTNGICEGQLEAREQRLKTLIGQGSPLALAGVRLQSRAIDDCDSSSDVLRSCGQPLLGCRSMRSQGVGQALTLEVMEQ